MLGQVRLKYVQNFSPRQSAKLQQLQQLIFIGSGFVSLLQFRICKLRLGQNYLCQYKVRITYHTNQQNSNSSGRYGVDELALEEVDREVDVFVHLAQRRQEEVAADSFDGCIDKDFALVFWSVEVCYPNLKMNVNYGVGQITIIMFITLQMFIMYMMQQKGSTAASTKTLHLSSRASRSVTQTWRIKLIML